jgi:hypothetical protein
MAEVQALKQPDTVKLTSYFCYQRSKVDLS